MQSTGSQTDVAVVAGPLHQPPPPAPTWPSMRQATFPTYDGKTDYAYFRAQFVALAAQRPVSEWAEALVVALREPASHVLAGLTAAQLSSFNDLDAALQMRFGQPRPRHQAVQGLKAARQQPDQTLREFGVHVDQLCRDAYRDDPELGRNPVALEKIALDYFLAGISDSTTRRLLLMSRPTDLRSALQIASELEDAPQVKRVRRVEVDAITVPTVSRQNNNVVEVPAAALATVLSTLTAAVRAVRQQLDSAHRGSSTLYSPRPL